MNLFSYKKFISVSSLFIVLFSNPIVAEQLLTKSEVLKKSTQCFKNFQYKVCSNLLLEMEKIQLFESEKDRYKCQASILGLQTELIESYYFKKSRKKQNGIMIPYVINNC